MAKIIVVNTEDNSFSIVASKKKAAEAIGDNANMKACATKEEFDALPEATRIAIADTDANVATLDEATKLERAYEVATKPAVKEAPAKPARAKGVKQLIRELFAVPGARHSIDDIMTLTSGTKVSVTTAISDLRSATYCKPGEPMSLTRLGDGKYALLSADEIAAAKADAEAAKTKAAEEKKAKAEAAKAEKAAAEKKAAAEAKSTDNAAA